MIQIIIQIFTILQYHSSFSLGPGCRHWLEVVAEEQQAEKGFHVDHEKCRWTGSCPGDTRVSAAGKGLSPYPFQNPVHK